MGFGWMEMKELFSKRFLIVAIPGLTNGARFALQNVAVSMMPARMFFIVFKSNIVHVMYLEAVAKHVSPGVVKLVTVITVVISSVGCILYDVKASTWSYSGLAFVAACAAALSDAVSDCTSELIIGHFRRHAKNKNAEVFRFLAVEQFFRVVAYVFCFLFEGTTKIGSKGIFYGWSSSVFMLAALTQVLRGCTYQVTIATWGALKTNLAHGFDAGAAYMLECLVGIVDLSPVQAVLSAGNASVVFVCALQIMRLDQANKALKIYRQRCEWLTDGLTLSREQFTLRREPAKPARIFRSFSI